MTPAAATKASTTAATAASPTSGGTLTPADVTAIRAQFPALHQTVRGGRPLVYLDNAATTLKPEAVLTAIDDYHRRATGNVRRGVHWLSEEATRLYEDARAVVASFVNAASPSEIVFTSGTTAAINLVAHSFGERLQKGDEILITWMEHHSNIVPWQLLAERRGVVLKVAPINDRGELDLDAFAKLLTPKTKLIGVAAISNALGTVNPLAEIVALARAMPQRVAVLVDGAQAVAHQRVDVQALDVDFFAFSAHKIYGPTGTGVLWGRAELLASMPPFLGGGDMIRTVSFEKTTYAEVPSRFEAGTPNVAGVIGLGAAIRWLAAIGLDRVATYENALLAYATKVLTAVPGLTMIGTARKKAAIASFTLDGVHPHDIGTMLDLEGVAVRAGHHCAEPVMKRFGVPATARASLAVYNTEAEIDALAAALVKTREMFA
jgi:cysteine desulfurase/selenocysteine lyase